MAASIEIRQIKPGSTDQTLDLFIQDSSATTGAGLTGLAFDTASLVCYYRRGATGAATALSLVTQTVGGAHADGGFVEISAANMPGMYRLDLSDAIVAVGVPYVTVFLKGAANMSPVEVRIQLDAAEIVQSGLYGDGAVWIDTTNGAAGTTAYVNGTQHNPCSTLASALTVAVAVGLRKFKFANGSSVNLVSGYSAWEFVGPVNEGGLGLGVQILTDCIIKQASIGGNLAAGSDDNWFIDCVLGSLTLRGEAFFLNCQFRSDSSTELSEADKYYSFASCSSVDVTDEYGYRVFTFGASNIHASFTNWNGNLELFSLASGDKVVVTGKGSLIVGGAGGSVEVHGMWTIDDQSGGLVTITGDWDVPGAVTMTNASNDIRGVQMRVEKNTALSAFPFLMLNSLTGDPMPGLTVTAERSIDGGAFAACANAVSEISAGWYYINLAAADLNGNTIALKFTATGAEARNLSIVTQA